VEGIELMSDYEYEMFCVSDLQLAKVVGLLLSCHDHSFEVTRSGRRRILISQMAADCLRKHEDYIMNERAS
jgi:hypothetical protein